MGRRFGSEDQGDEPALRGIGEVEDAGGGTGEVDLGVVEDHNCMSRRPATDNALEIESGRELTLVILAALARTAAQPSQARVEHLDDPVVADLGSAELPESFVVAGR